MPRLNKFSRLPQEDQTLILNLCEKLPYKEAAETLARPRTEGGLSFVTCASALCKFYYKHHPEAIATEATGQLASAIRFQHQAHGEANFEAILALVQNRLLAALRSGKPLADLDKDFRSLQRVQKCFLDDVKYRHKNEHTQDAYLAGLNHLACGLDEADYLDTTLEDDPGAGGVTVEDFESETTQLELDLEYARHFPAAEVSRIPTYFREAARIVAARKLATRKQDYLKVHQVNPAFALPELQDPTPESLLKLQPQLERATAPRSSPPKEISSQHTPKTPTISNISNNFQSHSPA